MEITVKDSIFWCFIIVPAFFGAFITTVWQKRFCRKQTIIILGGWFCTLWTMSALLYPFVIHKNHGANVAAFGLYIAITIFVSFVVYKNLYWRRQLQEMSKFD